MLIVRFLFLKASKKTMHFTPCRLIALLVIRYNGLQYTVLQNFWHGNCAWTFLWNIFVFEKQFVGIIISLSFFHFDIKLLICFKISLVPPKQWLLELSAVFFGLEVWHNWYECFYKREFFPPIALILNLAFQL
jgi:hypothetical protein